MDKPLSPPTLSLQPPTRKGIAHRVDLQLPVIEGLDSAQPSLKLAVSRKDPSPAAQYKAARRTLDSFGPREQERGAPAHSHLHGYPTTTLLTCRRQITQHGRVCVRYVYSLSAGQQEDAADGLG